ncbi:hypothetical protein OBBRIDRAFT_807873 [Obba rivulosa]|uniref:Uncharacterized protein n=1 Tax=Obba rivulosa TaxID=1052685 RepID=A0A8E2AIT6_9APHY|nr:hypothetical protein OBBRIDRAFT_807873 [Obba rivulosa]
MASKASEEHLRAAKSSQKGFYCFYSVSVLHYSNIEASAGSVSSEDDLNADLSWTLGLVYDSLKVDYQLKDEDVNVEEESDWEELENEDFFKTMIEFARDAGDDPRDKNWAPETRQSASKQS